MQSTRDHGERNRPALTARPRSGVVLGWVSIGLTGVWAVAALVSFGTRHQPPRQASGALDVLLFALFWTYVCVTPLTAAGALALGCHQRSVKYLVLPLWLAFAVWAFIQTTH